MKGLVWVLSAFLIAIHEPQILAEEPEPERSYETPTRKLASSEFPRFQDDLQFSELETAISRQLVRFRTKNLNGTIRMGGEDLPQKLALESLKVFLGQIQAARNCLRSSPSALQKERCYEVFNQDLRQSFNFYSPLLQPGDPRFGESKDTFFTAYYTPSLHGSRVRSDRYPYPIFSKPKEEELAGLSRIEIDFDNKLDGKGYEIFYADNLFDLYILQVQGGGRVVFEDGTSTYLTYDGTNQQTWRFISNYMIQKGYISDGSIPSQRKFLQENPDKQKEIYAQCPSYVYFRATSEPPLGNDSVSLTNNRTIATDNSLYGFKGLISYVEAERPIEASLRRENESIQFKEFSRFMLDQDTGGAIRGKGRVDLFFGEGYYAELAANNIQHKGRVYFLMLKPERAPAPGKEAQSP